jgi:polyisoprenoid-binding protein YceI
MTAVAVASARLVSTPAESDRKARFETSAGMHGLFNTTIKGTATGVTAMEDKGWVSWRAPVKNLDTGNGMRDRHLRERFKADQFPDIVLAVPRSQLKPVADNQTVQGEVTGQLTLAGTTRPIVVGYQARRLGADYHVSAHLVVNINQFGLETPCFAGVCVDPQVKVWVDRYQLRDL